MLSSNLYFSFPSVSRFVEYKVGSDEYMRMKFKVSGPYNQGIVQAELKKTKASAMGGSRS